MPPSEIPTLSLEEFEQPVAATEAIADESGGSQTFGVVGIGHCGSKLAQEFYKLGYKKTFVLNTALADLRPIEIPGDQKLLMDIGQEGAAKQVAVGQQAVEKFEQDIYDHFSRVCGKVTRILLCFGCGGGTGTGGIGKLIEIANRYLQSLGIEESWKRVSVLTTLPEDGELASVLVATNAYYGLKTVTEATELETAKVSSVFAIDNARVRQLYPGIPVTKYWTVVNSSIAGLFHVFNVLSAQSSALANFDPSDYDAVLAAPGFAVMGVASIKDLSGKEVVASQMRDNIKNALWATGFDLSVAKTAGVVVAANASVLDQVPQDVLNYGMEAVARLTGGAVLYRGIYEDARSVLRAYTVISGLKPPELFAKLAKTAQRGF